MCQGHNPHLDPKDNTDSRQLLYSCCVPQGFNLVHVSRFIRGIAIFTGLTGLYIDCTERVMVTHVIVHAMLLAFAFN